MSFIFKLFGAALLLFAAAKISRKYSEYVSYRASLSRAFSELLLHIKNKISVYLAPPSELVSGFSSEILSESGFISLAKELGSPKKAYGALADSLSLSPGAKRILDSYFDSFGSAYKEGLLKATEAAEAALRREAEKEEEELPREKKLARTVIFAVALGIIILFV